MMSARFIFDLLYLSLLIDVQLFWDPNCVIRVLFFYFVGETSLVILSTGQGNSVQRL